MNILILNPILFTAEHNIIPKVKSIKDTMIYNMCLGFIQLGHNITLAAAEEYHPTESETYEFNVTLNPQLHSRSATYIKRNGLLIRKITIKSSRPFQCAYHPLTP